MVVHHRHTNHRARHVLVSFEFEGLEVAKSNGYRISVTKIVSDPENPPCARLDLSRTFSIVTGDDWAAAAASLSATHRAMLGWGYLNRDGCSEYDSSSPSSTLRNLGS